MIVCVDGGELERLFSGVVSVGLIAFQYECFWVGEER